MSEIKDVIKNYVKLDEEIKEMAKILKPLRESKKKLAEEIIVYLRTALKEGEVIRAGSNVFRLVKRKTTVLDKSLLRDAIIKNANDNVADSVMEDITVKKENISLKRTIDI